MIFVTLGSQKFQFNRLLKKIDELIEDNIIEDEVFAQIGYSDYKPQNYKFAKFLDRDKFAEIMSECTMVITHGGTGAIIGAVKKRKKVIAVSRLAKYGEHVDDHQIQIIEQFRELNLICECLCPEKIEEALDAVKNNDYKAYESNTHRIIKNIEDFIEDKCL